MSHQIIFTLRATMGETIGSDMTIPAATIGRMSERVAADLRAAADQIERQGLSGYWENVAAAGADASGHVRVKHALKIRIGKDETTNAPVCPAPVDMARIHPLVNKLDALCLARDCVFPEDVINAANAHVQETGEWAAADVPRDFPVNGAGRDVLTAYKSAYAVSDELAKRVLARAILMQGVKL